MNETLRLEADPDGPLLAAAITGGPAAPAPERAVWYPVAHDGPERRFVCAGWPSMGAPTWDALAEAWAAEGLPPASAHDLAMAGKILHGWAGRMDDGSSPPEGFVCKADGEAFFLVGPDGAPLRADRISAATWAALSGDFPA